MKEQFGAFFHSEAFTAIYAQTSSAFKELVTKAQFVEMCMAFNQDVTSYEMLISSTLYGQTQTVWIDNQKTKAIVVTFDEDGVIQGLYLKPYIVYPETDRMWTKNKYRMPICDEWLVFWGGANEFINYHYPYESQRYAYDLVMMKEERADTVTSEQNEHYYAFGKQVVSPFKGKVMTVVNDVVDNVPGEMDEEHPAGNYVVIAHPQNEYSLIAHFKEGSIVVKPGETVKEGQLLGLCGNSGHSSEAHIHFQVMQMNANNEPAQSLRIRFQDGQEPVQGDTVKPLPYEDTLMDTWEDYWPIGEALLMIPKAIMAFFKS